MTIRVEIEGQPPITFPAGTSEAVIRRTVAQLTTGGGGAARGLGLGVRDVAQGLANVAGLVVDPVASFVTNPALRAVGVNAPDVPLREAAASLMDRAGLPRPANTTERILSGINQGVVGLLPFMGAGTAMRGAAGIPGQVGRILTANPTSQVLGAAGAGAASEGAAMAGFGPVGQIGAGLAGGVAGAALPAAVTATRNVGGAMFAPFQERGRERIVADVMTRASGDPEHVAARVQAGLADPNARLPGVVPTAAQASRDPGLAVLEQGLRSQAGTVAGQSGVPPAVAFRMSDTTRNAARIAALRAGVVPDDGLSMESLGSTIRGTRSIPREGIPPAGLRGAEERAQGAVGVLYGGVRAMGEPAIQAGDVQRNAAGMLATIFGPGAGAVPAPLRDAVDDMAAFGGQIPMRVVERLISRFGAIAGQEAAPGGDARIAKIAGSIKEALANALDDAAATGGMPETQAALFRAANAARRAMGRLFEVDRTGARGVGDTLARQQYGAPMLPDASVPGRVLRTADDARQFLAAARNQPEAIGAARRAFMDILIDKVVLNRATADESGRLIATTSPAAFNKFMRDNMGVAQMLFTPQQRQNLYRIARDFSESAATETMGRARGSDTFQNLSVANLISRITNGVIDPNSPAVQSSWIAPIARWLYQAPEARMRDMLTAAMSDARYAAILLQRATPETIQRAISFRQLSTFERASEIATGIGTRAAVRGAISGANVQPQ